MSNLRAIIGHLDDVRDMVHVGLYFCIICNPIHHYRTRVFHLAGAKVKALSPLNPAKHLCHLTQLNFTG